VDVERSVAERLYGDRATITATPILRGAAPRGPPIGSPYRLVEHLGAGGMATVYRARDKQLERNVAVSLPTAEPGPAARRRERADLRPAQYAEEPPHGRRGPRSVAPVSVACRSSNALDAGFASTRRTRTWHIPGASHVT
jgi:hypothetical protein